VDKRIVRARGDEKGARTGDEVVEAAQSPLWRILPELRITLCRRGYFPAGVHFFGNSNERYDTGVSPRTTRDSGGEILRR